MQNTHRHRESIAETGNPVDRIREGTNRSVWNRTGDVLHRVVDGTGKFVARSGEILETGVDHGMKVAGSISGIAGSVVGGTVRVLRKFGRGFQKSSGDSGSDNHNAA